jgi:hypothetical protein
MRTHRDQKHTQIRQAPVREDPSTKNCQTTPLSRIDLREEPSSKYATGMSASRASFPPRNIPQHQEISDVGTRLQFPGAVNKENDMNNDNTTKQQITRAVTRIGCTAALCVAFAFALPSTAHAQIVIPPVPPGLEVPAGNTAFLLGHGVGTQNYECQPVLTSPLGRVAWTLFTPQATLFNDQAARRRPQNVHPLYRGVRLLPKR